MELDREAVRLVADALEELELGRVVWQHDRLTAARNEHLLDALRERDDRDAPVAEALRGRILQRREVAVAQNFAVVAERRTIAAAGRARGVGESAREIERG